MESKENKVILYDSEEAAKQVTITGWASRHGHFYGDGPSSEHIARWDGCTHKVCETDGCDNLVPKHKGTICTDCWTSKQQARFDAMSKQAWDWITPLCLHNGDEYFFSVDDIFDYCENNDTKPEDLDLVICTPNYARGLEDDCFGELPEDCKLEAISKELQGMIDGINMFISENRPILSWSPGRTAAIVTSDMVGI